MTLFEGLLWRFTAVAGEESGHSGASRVRTQGFALVKQPRI